MDIPPNVSQLEPILQRIIRQNITLPEDEIKEANKSLQCLLLRHMEEEMKKDDTFRTVYRTPHYVGSYYENLRVGHPSEFDINLELDLPFREECIQIDTSGTKPGFTRIKVQNIYKPNVPDHVRRRIDRWIQNGFLLRGNVIQWLQGLVDRCLTRITWPYNMTVTRSTSGPAVTLNVKEGGKEFDVDLVPVFMFKREKWPIQPVRQALDIPREVNISQMKWCAVPKAPRNSNSEYEWRMSFYMIEKEIMIGLNNMKPVIKLFKLLRDKQGWGLLSSYYIKTLFMWEFEANRYDMHFWRKGLGYLFMHMLNVLQMRLEQKKIPFFWHQGSNLIEHLDGSTIANMAGRVKHIKKLIIRGLTDNAGVEMMMDLVFTIPSQLKQHDSRTAQKSQSAPSWQPESYQSTPLTTENSWWSTIATAGVAVAGAALLGAMIFNRRRDD